MSRRWDPCDSETLKKVSEQLDMVASGWHWRVGAQAHRVHTEGYLR